MRQIWVLNGSGKQGQASDSPATSSYFGLAASAPVQRPETSVPPATAIVVYNGAEAELTETIAYLEQLFGVTADLEDDPAARVDIVITTAAGTPDLVAPSGP